MGQVNERRYDVEGVTYGSSSHNPKTKMKRFRMNVDSININDGMLIILLHDRPLFLAVEYDNKKIKIGDCTVHSWGGEAQHGTTHYIFEMPAVEWQPSKFEENEWGPEQKMKLIVIDKAVDPIVAAETQEKLDTDVESSYNDEYEEEIVEQMGFDL
jgi:hypothetical protein